MKTSSMDNLSQRNGMPVWRITTRQFVSLNTDMTSFF